MTTNNHSFAKLTIAGLIGGASGGVVFGMLMAMMGMLPMIASMLGSDSSVVGFAIHMMMSLGIGVGFTLLFGRRLQSTASKVGLGFGYGFLWWVIGPLVMMPIIMNGNLFSLDTTALLSLMGHAIYALILAFVAHRILERGK